LIREAIAAGASQYGMQTFDQSLFRLVQSGLISMEEALHNASNADEFRMRASGILSAEQAMSTMRSAPGTAPAAPVTPGNRDKENIFVKH
jgi:twitching motility protein PilT